PRFSEGSGAGRCVALKSRVRPLPLTPHPDRLHDLARRLHRLHPLVPPALRAVRIPFFRAFVGAGGVITIITTNYDPFKTRKPMQDSPILRNVSTGDILTAFPTYSANVRCVLRKQ